MILHHHHIISFEAIQLIQERCGAYIKKTAKSFGKGG